jgi:hypothetical protein
MRQDPQPRHVEGSRLRIMNQDPSKHYVLPHMGDEECGAAYYESIGYLPVEYEEGGVRLSGRPPKKGAQIEFMGHVLMEIDQSRKDEIDKEGLFGNSGQDRADLIEEQIVEKKGGVDTLRGLHGIGARHGFKYENKTEPSEQEGPF